MEENESAVERYHLTKQDQAILALVADGCTDLEIAKALNLARGTVKNNLSESIYPKIGARNRTEAARWWWELTH